MTEALMTAADVAVRLSLNKKTFYNFLKSRGGVGFPQPIKFGPRLSRWRPADIEDYILKVEAGMVPYPSNDREEPEPEDNTPRQPGHIVSFTSAEAIFSDAERFPTALHHALPRVPGIVEDDNA